MTKYTFDNIINWNAVNEDLAKGENSQLRKTLGNKK